MYCVGIITKDINIGHHEEWMGMDEIKAFWKETKNFFFYLNEQHEIILKRGARFVENTDETLKYGVHTFIFSEGFEFDISFDGVNENDYIIFLDKQKQD